MFHWLNDRHQGVQQLTVLQSLPEVKTQLKQSSAPTVVVMDVVVVLQILVS